MNSRDFTVRDRLGPLRFEGEILSDKRWSTDKPRWTDMALYAVHKMAYDRHLQITVECEGCSPMRVLQVNQQTFDEGPILCGKCEKPFTPAEIQEEQPVRYALQITARSRVYHHIKSRCVKPEHQNRSVADMVSEPAERGRFQPCQLSRCKPPELADMQRTDRIAVERDEPQVYLCTSASGVVSKLYRRNGEITALASKLLDEAARKDPDIAAAISGRHRI